MDGELSFEAKSTLTKEGSESSSYTGVVCACNGRTVGRGADSAIWAAVRVSEVGRDDSNRGACVYWGDAMGSHPREPF